MKALIKLDDAPQVDIEVERADVVNMDVTMSILLLPLLRKFKQNMIGYPYEHTDGVADDAAEMTKWEATIDEIIWAMESVSKDEHFEFFGDKAHLNDRLQSAFELFGKNFCNFSI